MLIKCPECQRDVSDAAPSCPGCGYILNAQAAPPLLSRFQDLPSYHAPPVSKAAGGQLWWVFGIAAVIVIGIAVLGSLGQNAVTPAAAPQVVTVSSSSSAPLPVLASPWTYTQTADAMHDKPTKMACSTSSNEVTLSPPYSNVDAVLCIRQSPQYGLDVYVKLNGDGQVLCDIEGCSVPVRFDNGPVEHFGGASAADNSSNIIFLHGAPKLIAAMKRSKITLVQLRLYQDGDQQVTFPTTGLKW